jgi:alpha-galactosidase
MSTKIVLIGAGSVMFGLGAVGDILKSKALAGSTIVLNDINPNALAAVEDVAKGYIKERSLPFKIQATTSLDEALVGAQFCVISIEVGNRHELWEQDWKIPQQYGFRQVFGENGGPGGLFHALRIALPILGICERISQICPEALVFNLSNPMVRIMHAIHTKFPKLKCVGICHEVASLIEHLPPLLNTSVDNLDMKAGGFNHFSVLVEVKYKDTGKDAYPDVREKAPAYFANAPAVFGYIGERRLFQEVLKRFGTLPITTDSHFGEYIPWAASVVDHRGIMEFYNSYKSEMSSNREEARRRVEEGTSEAEYWRVVPIIEGIITNSGHYEMSVNIPNDGFIDYLPQNQIVEVPATVDRCGVHGVKLDPYPKGFAGLLLLQVAVNDLTTDAILSKSKAAALQALLVDPVVDDANAAEEMLETMISLQEKWLGYLK